MGFWDNNPLVQAAKGLGSGILKAADVAQKASTFAAANMVSPFKMKDNPLIQAAKAQEPQMSKTQMASSSASTGYVQPSDVFRGYGVDSVRSLTDDQKNKLAATLVAEGANEGEEGMNAILSTMINRTQVNPNLWGNNIFDVASKESQYSGFGDTNFAQVRDYLRGSVKISDKEREKQIKIAKELIDKAAAGSLIDNTHGATHYYAASGANAIEPPGWTSRMEDRGQIGNHRFYYSQN